MFGVNGKVLWINLTDSTFKEETVPEEVYRKYLTGYGLGVYMLNREMNGREDPLGPDNIFGVMTGVFNGHAVPLGGRFEVVAKSPYTGTWGDSNCGGKFGPELKNSGFDALFFRGVSNKPVYLKLVDGKYSIEDAADVWGKNAYEAEDYLRKIEPKGQALVIGVPGEKKMLLASIMNDYGRAAGRSGLGAVMGSKRLKGIIVRGTKKIEPFDSEMLRLTNREIQIQFSKNIELARPWQLYGTTDITEASHLNGDTPIKNWGGAGLVDFGEENAARISGREIAKDKLRSYGCAQCTLACGGHVRRNTKYGPLEGHRLEYEGTGSFGGLNLVSDLDSMAMAFEICNREGLDIISAGAAIAFANECYERGILTEKDIGFKIGFGDGDAMVKMVQKIASGEGIGSVLGDGAARASTIIGRNSGEFAMHVQGQDLPMHDPKLMPSLATTYLADPTPGRHTAGGIGFDEGGRLTLPFDYGEWSGRKIERYEYSGKGKMQALSSYGMQIMNSTGMCQFSTAVWPNSFPYLKLFKAIMGWDMTEEELMEAGKRIQVARHLFNYRAGVNPWKVAPNGRMVGNPPLGKGPTGSVTVDYRTLVKDYLEEVGIREDGKPRDDVLRELGIEV
ncbi:MAG: aldehyde ferredoxin oxidoreductase family protein [Candidatus Thermoplasmatota archaeon]|nr:aldehyde ferredoxin oxidoreductase family protein [Candidatus Thermoplasmatota archaeon]MCL5789499.1 aldehyde ferredoxin oxidoreductase family protein [Candidatus Thermoplasmatota archaeon]